MRWPWPVSHSTNSIVASSWSRPTWWRSSACCSLRITSGVASPELTSRAANWASRVRPKNSPSLVAGLVDPVGQQQEAVAGLQRLGRHREPTGGAGEGVDPEGQGRSAFELLHDLRVAQQHGGG